MPKDGQPARSPERHRRQERQASAHPPPASRGPSRLARERAALGLQVARRAAAAASPFPEALCPRAARPKSREPGALPQSPRGGRGEAGHWPRGARDAAGGAAGTPVRRGAARSLRPGRGGERPRLPLPTRLRSKGTEAAREAANRRPLRRSRPPNHPIAALRPAAIPPLAPPKDRKGSPGFAPPRPAGSSRPRCEMPKPLPGSDREGGHAGRQERAATGAEERHGSRAGDVILRTSCFPESEGAGLDLLWAEVSQSPCSFQDASRRSAHAQLIRLPLRVAAAAAAAGLSFPQ